MKKQLLTFCIIFLFIGVSFQTAFAVNTNNYYTNDTSNYNNIYELGIIPIDGQILYSPMYTTGTYLIDSDGNINHTWSSNYVPGAAVWWLGNGTILRTILTGVYPGFGGAGGGVRAGYPDFSLRTASLRCDEANAVNADILTTECPFCWRNLTDANELYDHGMKVMGVLQMITEYGLLDVTTKPNEEDFLAPSIRELKEEEPKK